MLSRYAAFSYSGAPAAAEMPDRAARNSFFAAVGQLPPLDVAGDQRLREMGAGAALEAIRTAVGRGAWAFG